MTFFVCDQCGCVEDSSLTMGFVGPGGQCSECHDGEWHHVFDKVQYDPNVHRDVSNRNQGDYDPSFG